MLSFVGRTGHCPAGWADEKAALQAGLRGRISSAFRCKGSDRPVKLFCCPNSGYLSRRMSAEGGLSAVQAFIWFL